MVKTGSEWRAIPDLPIQTQTVKHKLPWNDKNKTRPTKSDAARAEQTPCKPSKDSRAREFLREPE